MDLKSPLKKNPQPLDCSKILPMGLMIESILGIVILFMVCHTLKVSLLKKSLNKNIFPVWINYFYISFYFSFSLLKLGILTVPPIYMSNVNPQHFLLPPFYIFFFPPFSFSRHFPFLVIFLFPPFSFSAIFLFPPFFFLASTIFFP